MHKGMSTRTTKKGSGEDGVREVPHACSFKVLSLREEEIQVRRFLAYKGSLTLFLPLWPQFLSILPSTRNDAVFLQFLHSTILSHTIFYAISSVHSRVYGELAERNFAKCNSE